MKNLTTIPQQEVFWLLHKEHAPRQLKSTIKTDVAIIGGGIAGMSAAQAFHERGLKVALLEHYHCGAGASGKSSGFITANAELGLTHFVNVYGAEQAQKIWNFVGDGVTLIEKNIKNYDISCDYTRQDIIIAATSRSGFADVTREHNNFQQLGFTSSLYNQQQLQKQVISDGFYGGMRFGPAFGINAFAYTQAMKEILTQQGVMIFEETPVLSVDGNRVQALNGHVDADYIIVCADRFIPDLGKLKKEIFHVQTFIMMSNPLDDAQIQQLFPGDRYMMWDTDMVYQYYRITGGNRFLIGGSTMLHSFRYQPTYNAHMVYKKLTNYVKKKFPQLKVNFEYMWPGMIGISKDLLPVMGRDVQSPHIYYVGAATGLAWAATLGTYAAQHMIDQRTDFDQLFSPQRPYPLGNWVQMFMGKPATFALSNLIALKE